MMYACMEIVPHAIVYGRIEFERLTVPEPDFQPCSRFTMHIVFLNENFSVFLSWVVHGGFNPKNMKNALIQKSECFELLTIM